MLRSGRNSEVRTQKKVEEALRSKMKENAWRQCKTESAEYAHCVEGRIISVVWACRKQARELNECLHQYTTDKVLDQYKKDYLESQAQAKEEQKKQ